MRLIDADKFKCILPCNEEFHRIIDHARTVKAIPYKDIEKIRAEIMKLQTYKMFGGEDTVYVEHEDVLAIIDKYKAERTDT